MNIFIKNILLVLLLGAAFLTVRAQNESVSYIQIVHNCADPAMDTIDLYFNYGDYNLEQVGLAFVDSNVVYHTATGMIEYPTDSPFTISINHKHSYGDPNDTIFTVTYPGGTLGANERRAFILSGVQNPSNFTANPNGLPIGLSIQQVDSLDSVALDLSTILLDTAFVSARFFQGATDLPAVLVKFRNGGLVFPAKDSLKYGDTAVDVSMGHGYYEFQVVSPDTSQNFGTYSANFTGLGGDPLIILGSGFVNIDTTDSTSAFGLYALLNTGAVIPLPLEASGFQMLHNSADTAADSLDIYVNGKKVFPNLPFRNATPELVFKSYCTDSIVIKRKNSTLADTAIWSHAFYLPRDTFFIATISGLLKPATYAPNPDGISTAFQVLIKSPAEFIAASPTNFDFFMINGVTDAPQLDLVPQQGPYLQTNVEYADQTSYVSLPANTSEFYDLYVEDTSGMVYESAFANFPAFQSQSAVLLTSGFLNPDSNNSGPDMGLFMVPVTGGPFIPLYTPTGVGKIAAGPAMQVFPNPASNLLHILFALTQPQNISLQITDINGKSIKPVLSDGNVSGTQNITVDLNGFSQGIYFIRLTTSDGVSNSKFTIVR